MFEELKTMIQLQQFDSASRYLFQLLNQFEANQDIAQDYLANRAETHVLKLYHELAMHISELFLHPTFVMTDQLFYALILHKANLTAIFALSEYKTADHIINKCHDKKKHLLFYSFQCQCEVDWDILMKQYPVMTWMSVLALLSYRDLLTEAQEKKRETLILWMCQQKNGDLPEFFMPVAGRVWHNLVYDVSDVRYEAIKAINKIFKRWIQKYIIKKGRKALREKPVIVFPLEQFKSHHAVYRCLKPALLQLKNEYKLIAIAQSDCIDETSETLFDEVFKIDLKVSKDIEKIIKKILEIQPDIIFYLTLGMQYWNIALANARLAPIQIMSPSQAATSLSEHIDYALIHDEFYDPNAIRSEEAIVLPKLTYAFSNPAKQEKIILHKKKSSEKVHIIIPATYYKLSHIFINLCKEVSRDTTREVIYIFTPYLSGLKYRSFKTNLHQALPNALVYPCLEYEAYLEVFQKADLCFFPFPFGGTNSAVDAIRLAVPYITLPGLEPFARVDSELIRRFGLPEKLISNSIQSYKKNACELIENDELRWQLTQQIKDSAHTFESLLSDEIKSHVYLDAIKTIVGNKTHAMD